MKYSKIETPRHPEMYMAQSAKSEVALPLLVSLIFWCIGILNTIVFLPVIAHNVDVTAESIPPEIPITNDSKLFLIR